MHGTLIEPSERDLDGWISLYRDDAYISQDTEEVIDCMSMSSSTEPIRSLFIARFFFICSMVFR